MKQTEIGEIPEDWDFVKLSQVANFGGGTTPARKNYARYYLHGKHNWVKTLDLNNSFIYKTSEQITDEALEETSLKKHPKESVLVAMYGGFNQIGRTGLLKVDASINQALVAILPKSDILNSEYLLFNLNFNVDYWKSVASSSRKDPNITSQDVKNYPIAFSKNLDEQKEIAHVLTDTDNLIQATEQLIHKKQLIKTATMQNLLTGKIRLAEFDTKKTKPSELGEIPSDWEVKKLGDLLDYEQPTMYLVSTSKYLEKGSIPVLTAGKSFVLGYTEDKHGIYRNLPVIIFDDFTTDSKLVNFEFKAKSSAMKMLVSKDKSTPLNLIFALIQNVEFIVGDHKRHWISEFRHLNVAIPKSIEERNAISKILADLDRDINALKNRLGKLKDIKQGLMQNLLTGKIRLTE